MIDLLQMFLPKANGLPIESCVLPVVKMQQFLSS